MSQEKIERGHYWINYKHYGWVIAFFSGVTQWYHSGVSIQTKDIHEIDKNKIVRQSDNDKRENVCKICSNQTT